MIVPRGSADVAEAMRWAGEVGERVSIRSGGHSFDGFSIPDGGVLVDLQGLTAVEVRDGNRVALGPGARVKAVALELADRGLAVPIGNCPSVGIGGLASGGGFGFLTRGLGLTCDSLVEATVVTAAGEVVHCSAESNPELFWATRGGGGSAGVVTEFLVEAAAVKTVAGATLRFEWEAATDVIVRFCEVLAAAPDTLDLKLALRTTGPGRYIDTMLDGPPGSIPGTPFVEIEGQLLGPLDEALEMLAPLLDPEIVRTREVEEVSYHDAVLQEIPVVVDDDPAPPTLRPVRVQSDFARDYPDRERAEAIVAFVDRLQTDPELNGGGLVIEPSDGAVRKQPVDATAFVHRDTRLLYEWELFGHSDPGRDDPEPRRRALAELRGALGDHLTGGRYINYCERGDGPESLWGANVARLAGIVDHLDPERLIVSRLHPR